MTTAVQNQSDSAATFAIVGKLGRALSCGSSPLAELSFIPRELIAEQLLERCVTSRGSWRVPELDNIEYAIRNSPSTAVLNAYSQAVPEEIRVDCILAQHALTLIDEDDRYAVVRAILARRRRGQ
jgi:hypothetical protein